MDCTYVKCSVNTILCLEIVTEIRTVCYRILQSKRKNMMALMATVKITGIKLSVPIVIRIDSSELRTVCTSKDGVVFSQ